LGPGIGVYIMEVLLSKLEAQSEEIKLSQELWELVPWCELVDALVEGYDEFIEERKVCNVYRSIETS